MRGLAFRALHASVGLVNSIYFDNASTSWPKPPEVSAGMERFLRDAAGNPGRGGHEAALASTRIMEDVRARLARMIGASDSSRVVHCFNGTDALNMAIKGVLREGDHVVCTALDHNSVSRPLAALQDAGVVDFTRIGVGSDGFVDPQDVHRALRTNTRLVTVPHASNVTGSIQPVEEIGRAVREHGALFLVDAAQTVGVIEVNVSAMQADLLAAPGHKGLLGPTGTGFLYVGERATLRAWREGGTGSDSSRLRQPEELPAALEAGTPNTVGIAGLQGALDWRDHGAATRAERGRATENQAEAPSVGETEAFIGAGALSGSRAGASAGLLARERCVVRQIAECATELSGVRIAGPLPSDRTVALLSLVFEELSALDAAAILEASFGIQVRAGLHCAPFMHAALGTSPDGTVRFSPGPFTTVVEADCVCAALRTMADGAA